MNREEIMEIASRLPNDKRDEIAEMMDKASSLINSAECLLSGVASHAGSVLYVDGSATIWCNLYDLKKIFAVDYGKFLEKDS